MNIRKLMRSTAVAAVAAAAFGGAAASSADADGIAGHPCGLDRWQDGQYGYAITNCNTFAVYRRITKLGGGVGSCRYIAGRSFVTGWSSVPIIGYEGCTP